MFQDDRTARCLPELVLPDGKQVMGDGFYRLWWVKIAAHLDFIKPGQAQHALRHMVGTELKDQLVFPGPISLR